MNEHKISTDLFAFRHRDKQMIYAPFKQVAFLANQAMVNWLSGLASNTSEVDDTEVAPEIIDFLKTQGIIDLGEERRPFVTDRGPFLPTAVTLFLTNRCNLRCLYCYAAAGEHAPQDMNWEIAKAAIDLVAHHAKEMGAK